MDRLNTKDMVIRRNWHVDGGTDCVLCAENRLQTRDHLFFSCSFAKSCWEFVEIDWDMSVPFSRRVMDASNAFARHCFLEILS